MAEVSFGDWLKRQRGAAGLTQKQLAQQLNCSLSLVRKMEYEERHPSADIVERLAQIFDIPLDKRKAFSQYVQGDVRALTSTKEFELAPWKAIQEPTLSNLPSALASFIGRSREQNEIINLISRNRLVTLTGIGGIGKTQLALQVGKRILRDFPQGIWFVALDSLANSSLVPQTIASTLNIQEIGGRPIIETLTSFLHRKTTLIILDNCEHLLETCTQLIFRLLLSCPNLKILATSREVLNVSGESVYQIPPLSVPEKNDFPFEEVNEFESVRLFTERATQVNSVFELNKENFQIVIDICRKTEGIPLAIELVAARANILQVEEIYKQISNSFALLKNKKRSSPKRHLTLQASIEWSWNLLDKSEQIFLQQLSVFAGGWTLESAKATCDNNFFELTDSLVDKSFIIVTQEISRETRYRFHEIIRQYVRQKLIRSGEEDVIRTRHLKYFLTLSELFEPNWHRSEQAKWIVRINHERDNIRTAVEWAAKTDLEAGLYLTSRLSPYWETIDMREIEQWLAKFIQNPESKNYPYARAKALLAQGWLMMWFVQQDRVHTIAMESLDLFQACEDKQGEVEALLLLGNSMQTGSSKPGMQVIQQALEISQSLGDKRLQAKALSELGWDHSDMKLAFTNWEKAISLFRDVKDFGSLANLLSRTAFYRVLNNNIKLALKYLDESEQLWQLLGKTKYHVNIEFARSRIALNNGDYPQARACLEKLMRDAEEIGDLRIYRWTYVRLGHVALGEGNLKEASQILSRSVQEFQQHNNTLGVVFSIEGLAGVFVAVNDPKVAALLIGWANAARNEIGDTRPPIEQQDVDKIIEACLKKMGESAFADAYEDGKKMSMDDIVAFALFED